MEVYYKTRENKYHFDVQKNFAIAMGKKFLNIKKELDNKNKEENEEKDNKKEIIYAKEENMNMDKDINEVNGNALEINQFNENEQKEQDEIANMYNNPNFMEYGCTMQLYQKAIENKGKKLDDIIKSNYIIKEEEEDEKEKKILLKDMIV